LAPSASGFGLSCGTAVYAALLILRFDGLRINWGHNDERRAGKAMKVREVEPEVDADALLAGRSSSMLQHRRCRPALDAAPCCGEMLDLAMIEMLLGLQHRSS